MSLRYGTYIEFQGPPGRDHAELIWDVIEVGVQADQLGYGTFTCLEHPFFEQTKGWVTAGELAVGDTIRTDSGWTTVEDLLDTGTYEKV